MFDALLRPIIDPHLNKLGGMLHKLNITANQLTISGFISGLVAMYCITQHLYLSAFFFIFLNRVLDGLDGALARASKLSNFGGFLDIVCDLIIYSGIVFSFGINPNNTIYALFLIFSFIGPIASFLAFAIMAEKEKLKTTKRGLKSFYYSAGLCEGTETAIVLLLFCLIPTYFNQIALIYGILCWITTLGRTYLAYINFA